MEAIREAREARAGSGKVYGGDGRSLPSMFKDLRCGAVKVAKYKTQKQQRPRLHRRRKGSTCPK